jgi:hypothetical protein
VQTLFDKQGEVRALARCGGRYGRVGVDTATTASLLTVAQNMVTTTQALKESVAARRVEYDHFLRWLIAALPALSDEAADEDESLAARAVGRGVDIPRVLACLREIDEDSVATLLTNANVALAIVNTAGDAANALPIGAVAAAQRPTRALVPSGIDLQRAFDAFAARPAAALTPLLTLAQPPQLLFRRHHFAFPVTVTGDVINANIVDVNTAPPLTACGDPLAALGFVARRQATALRCVRRGGRERFVVACAVATTNNINNNDDDDDAAAADAAVDHVPSVVVASFPVPSSSSTSTPGGVNMQAATLSFPQYASTSGHGDDTGATVAVATVATADAAFRRRMPIVAVDFYDDKHLCIVTRETSSIAAAVAAAAAAAAASAGAEDAMAVDDGAAATKKTQRCSRVLHVDYRPLDDNTADGNPDNDDDDDEDADRRLAYAPLTRLSIDNEFGDVSVVAAAAKAAVAHVTAAARSRAFPLLSGAAIDVCAERGVAALLSGTAVVGAAAFVEADAQVASMARSDVIPIAAAAWASRRVVVIDLAADPDSGSDDDDSDDEEA